MKAQDLAYLAAAGAAAWALWRLYRAVNPAPVPTLGAAPAVTAPRADLVDIITGQSWGAVGAELADAFDLGDSLLGP